MKYEMTITADTITYNYNSNGITTGDTFNGWHYYEPYTQQPIPYVPYTTKDIGQIIPNHPYRDKSENKNEKELKGYIMKKLFNVYVIDDMGQFLMNRAIVAVDEEDAKFEARIDEVIRKVGLKYKDVTVVCHLISGGIKIKDIDDNVQLVKVVE